MIPIGEGTLSSMSHLSYFRHDLKDSFFTTLLVGSLSLLLSGCAPLLFFGAGVGTIDIATQERGMGGAASDGQIRAEINGFWFDKDIDLYRNVLLAVQDGRVMVMGYVPTAEQRAEAVKLAWEAKGVKEVINEIIVGPEPSTASSFEDVWISTKIRTLMLTTQDFPSNNYSITTLNGVVYVLGISRSLQEQTEALDLCKSVSGVTKVVNHLVIKAHTLSHESASLSPPTEERHGVLPREQTSSPYSPQETHPILSREEAEDFIGSSSVSSAASPSPSIQEESLAPPPS